MGSASPRPRGRKAQAARVVRGLIAAYPEVRCSLDFRDPYELTVATILSAQCTDARVNLVTPALFARFPDPTSLATGEVEEVEALIRTTGFFRNKAKNLLGMARRVVEAHRGAIPCDLESLTALPGVGRKTAHVVLGNAFAMATGVVVDTHVKRLAVRLGLTREVDPVRVEHDLAAIIPAGEWIDFSHRLIAHGRAVCEARRPRCGACPLAEICPKIGVELAG